MTSGKRSKRKRQESGIPRFFDDVLSPDTPSARVRLGPDGPVFPPGASSDPRQIDQVAQETSTEGATLFMDDPALGLGSFATGIDPETGRLTSEGTDTMEPIPVALFEPRNIMAATNTTDGRTVDIQIEAICRAGFRRLAPMIAQIEPAHGWTLRRGGEGLELRDSTRGVWATAAVNPDPYWISAASSHGWVLVCYGVKLGVRRPARAARYGAVERAAEFREGRKLGLTAAALVKWQV